jgi:hypothetical protein
MFVIKPAKTVYAPDFESKCLDVMHDARFPTKTIYQKKKNFDVEIKFCCYGLVLEFSANNKGAHKYFKIGVETSKLSFILGFIILV